MVRYVIIGGGAAGTTAAETLRKLDAVAEITIIDAESYPLYSRVLLRNIVKGQIERSRVFMKKPEWYETQRIELMNQTRVVRIDTLHKHVETSEGRELPYDKLLIASGGDVRLMEEDRRGVSYFRTLDDTDHLIELLHETLALPEGKRHGVTVGASFIALDYINIFFRNNIPQTVLMRGQGFWSKILLPEVSDMLMKFCEEKGIVFYKDQQTFTLIGERELEGVQLANGTTIPASMLGVGIGIEPDWKLFSEAGIETSRGVICNEFLETNVENVYTAGDVAEFFDRAVGRQHVVGNWLNAIMQGRTVAQTMHGTKTAFKLVTSYTTELLGKEMAFVGDTDREAADEVRVLKLNNDEAVQVFDRGGQTVGAVLIADLHERQAITNAIKEKIRYQP